MGRPKKTLQEDTNTQGSRRLRTHDNPAGLAPKENADNLKKGNRKRKIMEVKPGENTRHLASHTEEASPAKRLKEEILKRTSKSKKVQKKPRRLPNPEDRHATTTPCVPVPKLPDIGNCQVLVVGCGDVGQLGLGSDVLEKNRPTPIAEITEPVVDISAGGMHSVFLTNSGQVFTFGCNDDGTLGRVTEEEEDGFVPGRVDLPERVVQVSAGDTHTAALTESGHAYIWGNFRDSSGLMGLTASGEKQATPLRILEHVQVVALASGAEHLACLGSNGQIYTMGSGEQGQLGRIASYHINRGGRKGLQYILTPDLVRLLRKRNPSGGRRNTEFDRIWAGVYCTFAREKNTGAVFGFGLNNYNQLGEFGSVNIKKNIGEEAFTKFMPTPLKSFMGHKWNMVSGGMHHTLALDDEGRVYAWGRKEDGRLGLGEGVEEDQREPVLVPALKDIRCIHVACGTTTSYAITEDGMMYSWGFGENNQLGHGNDEDVFIPKMLESKSMKSRHAVKAVGGGQHTLILASPKEEPS